MAQILLQFLPPLANEAGLRGAGGFTLEEGIAEGETLGSVLRRLAGRYGASFRETLLDTGNGQIKQGIVVMVNARALTGAERLETQLADGDTVVFLIAFSGG